LVLFAFIVQSFSKSFIELDYYSNTAVYEKSCVNRSDKKMKCHGKCMMMKKMREEEQKEQQCPGFKSELKALVLFSTSFYTAFNQPVRVEIPNLNRTIYTTGKSVDRSLEIFHPPKA